MSIIAKPYTFSPNTTASSSQVNSNFDTLYNDYNGGISAANLATDAVTTAKIADSNVTTAKLADGSVTASKLATVITNYSTSEVDTGFKWTDGKTIYRKTVSFGALPNTTTKNVAHSISGLTYLVALQGVSTNGSTYFPIPFVSSSSSANTVQITVDATNISCVTGADRSSFTTTYVTLWYTK